MKYITDIAAPMSFMRYRIDAYISCLNEPFYSYEDRIRFLENFYDEFVSDEDFLVVTLEHSFESDFYKVSICDSKQLNCLFYKCIYVFGKEDKQKDEEYEEEDYLCEVYYV